MVSLTMFSYMSSSPPDIGICAVVYLCLLLSSIHGPDSIFADIDEVHTFTTWEYRTTHRTASHENSTHLTKYAFKQPGKLNTGLTSSQKPAFSTRRMEMSNHWLEIDTARDWLPVGWRQQTMRGRMKLSITQPATNDAAIIERESLTTRFLVPSSSY